MKKILIIFFLGTCLIQCSKNKIIEESQVEATKQYLEEIHVALQKERDVVAELMELQQVEFEEYIIGIGNKFDVYVEEEPDYFTPSSVVKPDGTISLKLVGEVKISDLTIPEASALIEKKYTKYIYNPKVTMIPKELKSANVTIMGKINHPGNYEIKTDMRLTDAIAEAGGFATAYFHGNTVEAADLTSAYMIRDNRILAVDLYELIRKGNMLHNIPLLDGDYIYIPSLINQIVYILGNITHPGEIYYKENMTVMQVIIYAGGYKDVVPSSDVIILRGGLNHPRVFRIDTKAILRGDIQDFPLKANDIVYLPLDPLTNFNRIVNNILPALKAVQTTWMMKEYYEETIEKY